MGRTPRESLWFFLAAPKFAGKRSPIERCAAALATNRGLMLIGEPGTAKPFLSELLVAANT